MPYVTYSIYPALWKLARAIMIFKYEKFHRPPKIKPINLTIFPSGEMGHH